MIKLRYVFGGLLCIGLLWKGIEGCSGFSSNSGVRKALKAGELSEAVEKCNASTSHEVSSDLLDALLKVGQVDKAKMLLQRLFPEDDRFWGFRDNYARASYTKLYKALIAAGRYDDAWECHELDTNDPNDAMNAKHYYTFMVDVVTALELQGKDEEAQEFIRTHIIWFSKNVDTMPADSEYRQEYSTELVQEKLQDIINHLSN
jgi:hypothetical protein